MTKYSHLRIVKNGETSKVGEVAYGTPDSSTGFRPMSVGPEDALPPEVLLHERIERIKASIKRIQAIMAAVRAASSQSPDSK